LQEWRAEIREKRECREALGTGEAQSFGESQRGKALRSSFGVSSEKRASTTSGGGEERNGQKLWVRKNLANAKKKKRENHRALK
jgi:hypothetical protein